MLDENFESETLASGVVVEYIDMGVKYTHNGRTLRIEGEGEAGEVSYDDVDDVVGYYELNEQGNTVLTMHDGRVFTLCNDDDWEAMALALLG